VDFLMPHGGDPINVGESGTFGLIVSFDGAMDYRFCSEQIPTPEPATLAMLALGVPLLLRRKR